MSVKTSKTLSPLSINPPKLSWKVGGTSEASIADDGGRCGDHRRPIKNALETSAFRKRPPWIVRKIPTLPLRGLVGIFQQPSRIRDCPSSIPCGPRLGQVGPRLGLTGAHLGMLLGCPVNITYFSFNTAFRQWQHNWKALPLGSLERALKKLARR